MIDMVISVFVWVCLLVSATAGNECCEAHHGDHLVQDNNEMWCADYCCHAYKNITETLSNNMTEYVSNNMTDVSNNMTDVSNNMTDVSNNMTDVSKIISEYYCCDDVLLQADSSNRMVLCADYFHQHLWIFILIASAIVAVVLCAACCYCCSKGGCNCFILCRCKMCR